MHKRYVRWFVLAAFIATLGIFSVTVLRSHQPHIEFYTADRLAVDYPGVEAGVEAVEMSWKAVNLADDDDYMRMEAWVGGRWVLIGEHFAPEKSDRIVVSHPLTFGFPLYRLTILNERGDIIDEHRLELTYADTATTPQIVQFIAPVAEGVEVAALESGDVYVPVIWHIENRGYHHQPVIEQVSQPAGEVVTTLSRDLNTWLPREGADRLRLLPVSGEDETLLETLFLRLRVVDTVSNQTLTEGLITLPIVESVLDESVDTDGLLPIEGDILRHLRDVHTAGLARGNNPHAFIRIGDSNIAGDSALCNFGWGNYDLGPYTHLQSTIDQFKDSWCAENTSAGRSFNSTSVLDPMWATDENCESNETPLDCAIRVHRPSYALIYIGVQDLERITWDNTLSSDYYEDNLRQILSTLTDDGIIPILSTFPTGYTFHNDGSADALNAIIRGLATELRLLVIDLRAMTLLYPNRGVDVDGFHMSTPPGGRTSFTGNESLYARTFYELRVLELLHEIERTLD